MPVFSDDPHIRLVLPSNLSEVERVLAETEAFLEAQIDDAEFVYRAVLLTTEAVTNAIEHGNGLDEAKRVKLDVTCGAKQCVIMVEDEGAGFERGAVADPLHREHLLADRGRGLFLLEAMANEVRYENGGRRVIVVLDRASPPPLP